MVEVGSIKTMEPQGARENPGDIGEEVGGCEFAPPHLELPLRKQELCRVYNF